MDPKESLFRIFFVISEAACVSAATFLSVKIYFVVRRHINQIQALQLQQVTQNGVTANAGRPRKYAIAAVYVYLVFLVCYLPHTCVLWYRTSESSYVVKILPFFYYDACVCQFIFKSSDLLLEDKTGSTRYHRHTAENDSGTIEASFSLRRTRL